MIRFFSFIWKFDAGGILPALVLMYFFSIRLQWLPVITTEESWESYRSSGHDPGPFHGIEVHRQIRAAVLEEVGKDYVTGARARGIRSSVIIGKSVLRASMLTILTLLALSAGSLLGGTAIVETIFMWDGVGKMAVDAITMRDYPVIQAYVVWMAGDLCTGKSGSGSSVSLAGPAGETGR